MSCNPHSPNDSHGWLGDVSSSTLDGLDAHINDLRAREESPLQLSERQADRLVMSMIFTKLAKQLWKAAGPRLW